MKIVYWRFNINTLCTFWDRHTWDIWKACFQTIRNNRICLKLAYFLRNLQTSRANNSRILRTKNAKFSRHYFYMNTNITEIFKSVLVYLKGLAFWLIADQFIVQMKSKIKKEKVVIDLFLKTLSDFILQIWIWKLAWNLKRMSFWVSIFSNLF